MQHGNQRFNEPLYAPSSDTATSPAPEAKGQEQPEPIPSKPSDRFSGAPRLLLQALIFGFLFGFLLQKGGVAKFDVLIGQLLLADFTVVQVMLSAIIVGMVGVYVLNRMGLLEMQIKPTSLGANVLGGLIFGLGFGLLAYCPGTDAAAVGQGNFDALVGVAGMIVGSYVFALSSNLTDRTISTWGQLGKLTLPQVVHLSPGLFIAIAVPVLIGILVLLENLIQG